MRIGFDLRPAIKKNSRRRGIGKCTHQLLKSLLELNRKHEYVLYSFDGEKLDLADRVDTRDLPYLRRPSRLNWLLDLVVLPRQIRRDRLEIFHATEITSIPTNTTQVWVHVHDLIPLVFWNETVRRVPRDYVCALQQGFKRIEEADLIITDSKHSQTDICRMLGVPETKVQVIYLGCDDLFRPVNGERARAEIREKYGVNESFLFYVGGSDFRKNLPRLISAFAQIQKRGYEGKLVLAGETFLWGIPEIRELRSQINRLSLQSSILFTGYVPDQDLPLFYSACDLLVFPSLYEGFGLPVLEAMKCGAPVITSHCSSIPEVAGQAAVYFNPVEEESMVWAFEQVYGNEAKVRELRQKGFQQAAQFSWRRAAAEIHELYNTV